MNIFLNKIHQKISWYWQYIFYEWEMYRQEKARLKYADIPAFQSVILMFHIISEKTGMPSCTMTPAEFSACLDFLAKDWEVVPMKEAAARICKGDASGKKFAVLTFDDISETFYSAAWSELKKRNMPYTLFVSPGLIDQKDFANKSELQEIIKDPLCTLGGHTISHCMLRFSREKEKEIRGCGEILRQTFGIPVEFFAYPYGTPMAVSAESRKIAEKSGYDMVFSAIPGTLNPAFTQDHFWIPRVHSRLFMEWQKKRGLR